MSFIHHTYYRWWQLNYCCIHLTLVLGVSMNPSWLIFFQMGWWKTHQLAIHWKAPSKAGMVKVGTLPIGFPPHWVPGTGARPGGGFKSWEQTCVFFFARKWLVKMKIDWLIYDYMYIIHIYILFIYIIYILYIYYIHGCFLKCGTPKTPPKWSFLVGTPMVVGYHHFRKPPYIPENEDWTSQVGYVIVPWRIYMSYSKKHPTMDGCKTILSFRMAYFQGRTVSFREGTWKWFLD